MVKNHIKRINAPKRWDILRKENKFISRPNPGITLDFAVSLNTALKEILGKTKTTKESKYLIRYKQVLVNGVRRYDEKFPVGFLDVLSLPESQESYRLIITDQNKLAFVKVSDVESKIKISKVYKKIALAGGKMQVACTDGRNFLMTKEDAGKVSTNDTIVYSIPDQKVTSILKFEKGSTVFLYQGKHAGNLVKIEAFDGSNIMFKEGAETLETRKPYAFVVGKDTPVITMTLGVQPAGGKKAKN
ncbi:hypothetical protein JW826_01520 [Candidatus Woesearchaeota archaeon]|nr:hypothetical protein [Candidatus Woesearchaeota archaeon]